MPPAPTGGYQHGRIFDDKVAIDPKYAYNGTQGGDRWKVKTKGYLISKAPALKPLLAFADALDREAVTTAKLDGFCTLPSGGRVLSAAR